MPQHEKLSMKIEHKTPTKVPKTMFSPDLARRERSVQLKDWVLRKTE